MIHDNVSLMGALPPALATIVPVWVWMITLVLAAWSLVRLRHPTSMILAATLVAALALLLFAQSTIGWVASPALVLAGFALFRRPGATTTIIFVAVWTMATWTNWGWETAYEETGACIFPGAFVLHTYGIYEDEVRCELPAWT